MESGELAIGVILLVLFVGLFVSVGISVFRSRKSRIREDAANLATLLGFELVEGTEAVRRSVPEASEQAAMENYERLPALLRRLVEKAASFVIVGTVDGTRIVIHLESRRTGKSQTTYTVVRADYPTPLPYDLRVGHEGMLTRLGKALFGLRDVEVDDEEFDRVVRIKAGDETAAKLLLGRPEAKAAILDLLALSRSAYATQSYAGWERQGVRFDVSEMRSVIGKIVPVARVLGNS